MGKKKVELADIHKAKTFAQLNKGERQERRKQIELAIAKRKTARVRKSPEERKAARDAKPRKKGRCNSKAAKEAVKKKGQASAE